jgi:hypothetical protein
LSSSESLSRSAISLNSIAMDLYSFLGLDLAAKAFLL